MSDDGDTFRVPIDRLRFKDFVPAGMNPFTLYGLVPLLRTTNFDHAPILVSDPCECCEVRICLDGRHRWIASVLAGRPDVLARRDPDWPSPQR